MMQQGRILKGIGGFYYVESNQVIYECKARGVFRKRGLTPLAGDLVEFTPNDDATGAIEAILPRKTVLVRPACANLDQMLLIVSVCAPAPNLPVLDKMLAVAVHSGITPILVLSKTDLASPQPLLSIYENAGIQTLAVSAVSGAGIAQLKTLLQGKISVFTGNSGVGKSSLLNQLDPRFSQSTGAISTKLGRGRHTTRQVELLSLPCGGYVADTPGFSTVDVERYSVIQKEELPGCFPEFQQYLSCCKFTSCSHTCERGCAVLQAVQQGEIAPSRHQSYVRLYQQAKEQKPWEQK